MLMLLLNFILSVKPSCYVDATFKFYEPYVIHIDKDVLSEYRAVVPFC